MRQIINGKMYNTDTATLVAEDWYSSPRDFRHWREELYKKRTGEFFLYGAGGPATKYRVSVDQNSYSGGTRIIPYSEDDAKEWLEKHGSVDEYILAFGEVEE